MDMTSPISLSFSASSDYFDDDPEFLEALKDATLPGDETPLGPVSKQDSPSTETPHSSSAEMPPCTQPGLKRRWVEDDRNEQSPHHKVLALVDENPTSSSYMSSNTYGASRFGEFGEYMSRKRAKLQIQNAEMDGDDGAVESSRIFRGLQIYINGFTKPSVQDLRQLIVQHGGIFHAYLDRKSLVTHIITCSLTPAKIREFQHMKVVRPEWLVESAKADVLLPWHNFIFTPSQRLEESQGMRGAQKSLLDGFASESNGRHSKDDGSQFPNLIAKQKTGIQNAKDLPTSSVVIPSTPPRTPTKHISSKTSPLRPLYTTDPTTPEQAERVHGYAASGPNAAAERAMADPAWRAAHTSVAPDFVEGYYRNSRLHHLSAWKAELRNLVAEAQERAENSAGPGEILENETDESVGKILCENMHGKDWVGDGARDVSMKGAQLVRKGKGKAKQKAEDEDKDRVIMHCDFDSFFVSAGLVDRPHLRGKPVVVCHSQGSQGGQSSTSEIASASYEARKYGVKGGMSLQQARNLCPGVITIPYEFNRYKQFSLQFYTILMAHADDLQAVSVDEALIDVTSSIRRILLEIAQSRDPSSSPVDPAKGFAEAIRAQVKKATGCEVSIGIAHNIMLARLASRRAKPAGSFHLQLADLPEFIATLNIDDLHGFGYAALQKAEEKLGTTNLGELAKKSKAVLCDALGKGTGETLYNAIRGVDGRKLESDKPRKSVSCDINYGIRFENNEQAEAFIYQLAEEVARRLDNIDMRGRSLTLKIMTRDPNAPVEAPKFMGHGICETFAKQVQLVAPGGRATSDDKIIGEHAWRLLKGFKFDPKELRGIGIQIQKLENNSDIFEGQAVLPFKSVESPQKSADVVSISAPAVATVITVQPPSQDADIVEIVRPSKENGPLVSVDLPSFSQVDMSVFEALPKDVRQELEMEYKRRSITPALAPGPILNRSPSMPVAHKAKITIKGTNVRRITRQLAPKSRAGLSSTKSKLFTKPDKAFAVKVSQAELRKLDIDPSVFAALPVELQREQLAFARQAKAPGGSGLVFGGNRIVIKPRNRFRRNRPLFRQPPPKARYRDIPSLKRQGRSKGEKLYFTDKDDIQEVIEAWVNGFTEYPPNQKDVDFFAKYLVHCVDHSRSGDSSLEQAIAVAKWWLVLLRRNFGLWEHVSADDLGIVEKREGQYTSEFVGRVWWNAFREVKKKMDAVARKRFGGSLSLR